MSESIENATISPLLDTIDIVNQTINSTEKQIFIARTDGLILSYAFLVLAALFCVYIGSYRSIILHDRLKKSGEKLDILTTKGAAIFPFIASGFLLSIYLIIVFISKEYITLILNIYFFFIGIIAIYRALDPLFLKIYLRFFAQREYHLKFAENETIHLNITFELIDLFTLSCSFLIAIWYLFKRHWIANNLLGIAFSINAIEILHFNKVLNGCVLLSGLFIYDIFWVFGTDVMITVAKSFDAPIKLIFPQDLIENGIFQANKFAMLGLGDIAIPGAFIALMLRYDLTRKSSKNLYFNITMYAYTLALMITILILQIFKHGQPALLYIVPLCLGFPLITSMICKEWTNLFAYEDHPNEKKED